MGILESIKKGFSVAKASTQLVMVLFAFTFVWNLINIPFQGAEEVTAGTSVSLLVLGIAFILVSIFMQAGSLGYVLNVVKQGTASLGTFTDAGKKYYLRILGIGLIVALFIIILTILAVLVLMIGGPDQTNPVGMVFAVVLAVVGMLGIFLMFMAPYIAIADELKVVAAIQASIQFVKNNILKVLGIGAILVAIGFLVGLVLGLVIGLLGAMLGDTANLVVSGFLSSAINAYLGVVTTGAFMAYYLASKTAEGPAEAAPAGPA